MDVLKKARRPVRREFEKLHKELETLLKEVPLREDIINVKFNLFRNVCEKLSEQDNRVLEQLQVDGMSEADEDKENDEILEFKTRAETIRVIKEKLLRSRAPPLNESFNGGSLSVPSESRMRNFKVQKVTIKKFSGELLDWLRFWSQFKHIDEDQFMSGSEKFWHLLESLEPGTDPYRMACGYPQTDENYPLIIAALKKHYGNEDLLLQVYIRQLLNLVITNVSATEKVPVKDLHLQLSGHLRALKTLNLQQADPASWLFPLVESSLPEHILYAWHRSSLSSKDASAENPPKTRLDYLMEFVEREVQISQNIDLTKSFNAGKKDKSNSSKVFDASKTSRNGKRSVPTLSSFHHGESMPCPFCDYKGHMPAKCRLARKMKYEEKINKLRAKGSCFKCAGKFRGDNCDHSKLDCFICHGKHLAILCKDWKVMSSADGESAKRSRRDSGEVKALTTGANFECTSEVALQTLMVVVKNGDREERVRAFIDQGSQRSYMLTSTTTRLGLKSFGRERVFHSLFGGQKTRIIFHRKFRVLIRSVDSGDCVWMEVRNHHSLCGNIPRVSETHPDIVEELEKRNVTLSDQEGPRLVELLIGADMYPYILTGGFIQLQRGAAAIKTRLGWTVIGQTRGSGIDLNMANSYLSMCVADANIAKLWELEAIGIFDPFPVKSRDEESIIKTFEENISRTEDGRYSVKLPWKISDIEILPSNYEVAKKRLENATRKLQSMNLFVAYTKIFEDWEQENFIEKVDFRGRGGYVHYVPHRPVLKIDSLTTPVRPVFDASCRVGRHPSLNDLLIKGENYVKNIPDILLRFREKAVAFVSDIRKAFQMIELHPDDRDFMRFLWWKNEKLEEIVEYRHKRVMFGAKCSPFILGSVLQQHLRCLPASEKEIGEKLLETFYVDNCLSSEETIEKYLFRKKSTAIMKRAQMDLRMWMSNVDEFEDPKTHVISVLGLNWDRIRDELFLHLKDLGIPEKITKRIVLSILHKIFDPIGFTCPALLPLKLILQKAWLQKLNWDQELRSAERKLFLKWFEELPSLREIRLPRLATKGNNNRESWSLHTFGDASEDAYSAVVFLRVDGDEVSVDLLGAKARISPVKIAKSSKGKGKKNVEVKPFVETIQRLSIPKLELMACVIGTRLAASVKKALGLENVPEFYWSDSTTALAWIKRNDQWGTFVANRVKDIEKEVKPELWHHVPGKMNPADLPSRGCSPSQLLKSKWWEGPDWLYKHPSHWPSGAGEENEEEIAAERKRGIFTGVCLIGNIRYEQSYLRMVRIVGWVRRFLLNRYVKDRTLRISGPLTENEIKKAEFMMVRSLQQEENGDDVDKRLHGLEHFTDSWGVLRVKTRLTYREDCYNFKYPMILPGYRPEVRRLILDVHRKNCHAGVGMMMTILRQEYWITQARKSIKSVLRRCFRCRKLAASQCIPKPAPLPLDRVQDVEVFENVGVDLAGPFYLKGETKMWLVIFTCAVYRAVHFEFVKKISTRAFIEALGKFIRRFRRPATIYSDNGTNFRGAANLFQELDWEEILAFFELQRILFKFIPALSPWYGGWWERLIRTAKDLLKRTVGNGVLNMKEFEAVVMSVANVMNQRPLTYVSEDPQDLEPLTPAMFLHPFGSVEFPEEEMTEAERMRFRFKYVNTLKQELRDRFRKEYLSTLVSKNRKKATRCLNVGELVLVGSDNLKRMQWPLGRILELIPGTDGIPRMARVKTATGEFTRSFQRLYPLEMDVKEDVRNNLQEKGLRTRSGREVKLPKRYK